MNRKLVVVLRVVILLAAICLLQYGFQWFNKLTSRTYQAMPEFLFTGSAAILFGALLRCDVFFSKGVRFSPDWFSLLVIGIPALLITFYIPIFSLFLQEIPFPPGILSYLVWGGKAPPLAGLVLGYTVINSLFRVEAPKEPETPR